MKIDFDHFDKDSTSVLSIGEWSVIDAKSCNLDLMQALAEAVRCRPIATCNGPVRLEAFLPRPFERHSPVGEIAACLADGGAHGDDPGR